MSALIEFAAPILAGPSIFGFFFSVAYGFYKFFWG